MSDLEKLMQALDGDTVDDAALDAALDWHGDQDCFLRFDDTPAVAAAITQVFGERPNADRQEMATTALENWAPCPRRLELPN
jgi:hypothetical protein